jgi:2-C-methyl-D-erythritol 4-phosphate cytidylyltransferase/2-C-methyl-D-erythritol 2,4-cyclodiphosphate synthase
MVGMVVVAAGTSRRFGSDKLALRLGGRSVLQRAVGALRAAFPEAPLAVVVRAGEEAAKASELAPFRPKAVVPGGAERQDSVRAGVKALGLPPEAIVVIHDAARPFVPREDVLRVVEAAARSGAAVLAAPVVDTVKQVGEDGRVLATLPREQLVRSLTPQAFRVALLLEVFRKAPAGHWTDEAAALEHLGVPVVAVPGDPRNLKLTRPEDAQLLRGLFPPTVRVGQGVDVHPFAPGRPLMLGGVRIPWELGLAGHSDADVVLHAVADAIFGAAGEGDLGEHFPPGDPRWAGADSRTFVAFACERARAKGLAVGSCDVTVLAEKPRLAPHREAVRQSLAALLGVPEDAVGVKATTTERLGFLGRGEGIAALALVVLVGE